MVVEVRLYATLREHSPPGSPNGIFSATIPSGADPAGEVHDVRVPLYFHVTLKIHRAGLGHTSKVVAAKVYQHDVFGAFLGIVAQLGGKAGIFKVVGPAFARASNGRKLQMPRRAAHHDFGRRAEKRQFGKAHVKHVRRRVEPAHAAVQLKGIALKRRGKPHRGNHLNGLALPQHFLDAAHIVLVALLARFGAHVVRINAHGPGLTRGAAFKRFT